MRSCKKSFHVMNHFDKRICRGKFTNIQQGKLIKKNNKPKCLSKLRHPWVTAKKILTSKHFQKKKQQLRLSCLHSTFCFLGENAKKRTFFILSFLALIYHFLKFNKRFLNIFSKSWIYFVICWWQPFRKKKNIFVVFFQLFCCWVLNEQKWYRLWGTCAFYR